MIKQGLLIQPRGLWWEKTHCYLPTPWMRCDPYGKPTIRIFYTGWDEQRVGRIGYVEVDAEDPTRIIDWPEEPLLDIGEPGMFDDSGVTASCVLAVRYSIYLYYIGWQRHWKKPYSLLTGLAVSKDGGRHFTRVSETPILERNSIAQTRSAPYVLYEMRYRMWGVAGSGWSQYGSKSVPNYHIAHLQSWDAIHWDSGSKILLPEDDEIGLGRPWIIFEDGRYKVYFSRRFPDSYLLGYAESEDGYRWVRGEDPLTISEEGWDSEMVCFGVPAGRWFLYNGNRHGVDGIGYALRTI